MMNSLIVVDDEPALADFVAAIAKAASYQVRVAHSVEQLLAMTAGDWPTVLISDLQMPGTDGLAMLRELGERGCTSKIVLLSGMDERVLDTAFRLGGAVGLAMAGKFSKPIRARELTYILTELRDKDIQPTAEALSAAIDSDALYLLYQPKIDIPTRRMVGVEALVRWKNPAGRVVPPSAFIPLAESSGLIDRLTWWVLRAAIEQAGQWLRKDLNLKLAINLSAGNIHDRQLPDKLAELCATAAIAPECITLELTETASTKDYVTLLEVLGRFRIKGFHLSIDDFGTGYSSVAQLLRLPFSELKVDRSFVSGMDKVHEAAIVAKTLIDMAHNLGLLAVAEGVETENCQDMLQRWGCDIAQGYLFSKPVSPEAIEALAASPAW